MRKTIEHNKKIILVIIIIILIVTYYFFIKRNKEYYEFEGNSSFEEIIEYEKTEDLEEENLEQKLDESTENIETENQEKIIVHITGEVENGGVIELNKGSRIIDAVNIAGGFTDEADDDKVNLAYVLTDAVKIYIPNKNEDEESVISTREYISTDSGDNTVTEEEKMKESTNLIVNINSATQTELETLPGIGPSIALKIITYREENGKFSSIEDIKNVSGIGDNKFNNIKELISI